MAASGDTPAFTLYDALVRTPMAHSAFTDEVEISIGPNGARANREDLERSMAVSSSESQLLGVEPRRLVLWDTFDADVAPEPTEAAVFAKQVSPFRFETARRQPISILMNEADASLHMNDHFIKDCRYMFANPDFGLDEMRVAFHSHPEEIGARPDALWSRSLYPGNSAPLSPGLFGTEFGAGDRVILAHEHKSPFKFPYKATFDEMLNDAVDFLVDEDPHFDKNEEYSRHATWMIANRLHQYYAEHDLVEFSESVSRDTSLTDGRKHDLLYPIHQVYAYMLRTFCRFGVLSTTNITWFLKLEPDNTLRITKGYDCTGNTEATNPKYAYFRLLLKASKGSRLTLDSASLDSLGRNANLNVAGSPWKAVFDQIVAARTGTDTSIATASGSGAGPGAGAGVEGGSSHHQVSAEQPSSVAADVSGGGGAVVASDGDDEARLNFLRQTLPLPQSVFPYFGGVKDLLWQNSDAYGHLIYVDTGGLQQLIAVKTPHLDPYHERDDETDYEDMRRLQAFTNEIEVYETLRPLWGSRHVPWFLYRGRHLFADVIVATTWEGHTLKSHFRKPSQYSKAVVDKARETLLMVHGLGVALRVDEPEDLASTFVLDDHGEVRLTRFRNATIKATPAELAQDIQDFNKHFLSE